MHDRRSALDPARTRQAAAGFCADADAHLAEIETLARNGHAAEIVTAFAGLVHPLAGYALRAAVLGGLGSEILDRLAQHCDPWVRHAVALRSSAPDTLARLAADEDAIVRAAAAQNAETPVASLAALLADVRQVRTALATNRRAGATVLAVLATTQLRFFHEMLYALSCNPALPDAVRACVARHPSYRAPEPARAARPTEAADAPLAVLGPRDAWHPSYPVPWLVARASDPDVLVPYAMARHPWLPEALQPTLAAHGYESTRSTLARAPGTTPASLVSLANDPCPHVRAAVATNPRTPAGVLASLCTDPSDLVRMQAAQHPGVSTQALHSLATDACGYVRSGVLFHPDPPRALVETLATDPDPNVRQYVPVCEAAAPEIVAQLADDDAPTVRRFAAWRLAVNELAGANAAARA